MKASAQAVPSFLAVASGTAGFVWQGLWNIQFATVLGHEWMAVLGVTAAMFLGMALGAGVMAPAIKSVRQVGMLYAAFELGIGIWGMFTLFMSPFMISYASRLLGEQPSRLEHVLYAFVLTGLALGPAAVAIGASLPALVRAQSKREKDLDWLYGLNTLGAMAGVLLTVWLLVPLLGVKQTGWFAASVNFACALSAAYLWRRASLSGAVESGVATHSQADTVQMGGLQRLSLVLALSGLLGIGYETLCVRVLSQVMENTVFSYAVLIAVYLAGNAGGALCRSRVLWIRQLAPWRVLGATGIALVMGSVALWWVDVVFAPLQGSAGLPVGSISTEFAMALCAMLLPSFCMGVGFTALCDWAQERGKSLGTSLAANMAGAALAPACVGAIMIPQLGMAQTSGVLIAGYALTAYLVYDGVRSPLKAAFMMATSAISAIAITGAIATPLRILHLESGSRLRFFEDGVMAAVSVIEDSEGILRLRINNRVQEGSSAASPVETRLALIPLLLHPNPRQSLFLGWGTGYTARVAARADGLHVDAVELIPEVVRASELFKSPDDFSSAKDTPRIITADARRFVLGSDRQYDIIVADLFHPARSGAGSLYTVEHFEAMSQRLAPGGVICQWIALHQLEWATFRPILAAFRKVFPEAIVIIATNSLETPVLGLISRREASFLTLPELQQRIDDSRVQLGRHLEMSRLVDAYAVMGTLVAGPAETARWVRDVKPNSDDFPRVTYMAPWDNYEPSSSSRQRISVLLSEAGNPTAQSVRAAFGWSTSTTGKLDSVSQDAASLASYIDARNRYLRLGISFSANLSEDSARDALRYQLQLLLSTSPQFTPAIDALRSMRATSPDTTSSR
ncbi:MAG: hypothetical protein EBS75_02865 [Betaproteobacteria bacterium]|nr:hypothetical protein [Betaproteobacteria bacterium]